MIKYLAFEYQSVFSFLNIFSYITFRSGASILTGLLFSLIFGNFIINKLSNIQPTGQPIREDGPESHLIAKKGTPTMGGLLIILSVLVSTFLWADLRNSFISILKVFLLKSMYSPNNIEPINILCQTITSEELAISSPNIAVKPAINTKKCR